MFFYCADGKRVDVSLSGYRGQTEHCGTLLGDVSVPGRKDAWSGVNPSAETLPPELLQWTKTQPAQKKFFPRDFLVIKTKKFFSCNQNKGA